jgi:hypothetical protein
MWKLEIKCEHCQLIQILWHQWIFLKVYIYFITFTLLLLLFACLLCDFSEELFAHCHRWVDYCLRFLWWIGPFVGYWYRELHQDPEWRDELSNVCDFMPVNSQTHIVDRLSNFQRVGSIYWRRIWEVLLDSGWTMISRKHWKLIKVKCFYSFSTFSLLRTQERKALSFCIILCAEVHCYGIGG